jgi:hypothetical protein
VLSNSVSDARKTASAEPNRSTNFRARVGPSPGVIVSATHSSKCVAVGEGATIFSTAKLQSRQSAVSRTAEELTAMCTTVEERPFQGRVSRPS